MVDHRAVTIQSLPNETLLYVFSFHRLLSGAKNRPPAAAWRWHTLAHVCQRWRDLIFTSLRYLEARLIIPRKSPKKRLDSCPALPLSVWYDSPNNYISNKQRDDINAAFKHSDRIREIHLPTLVMSLGSFWTLLDKKSLPELEHLALPGSSEHIITLPPELLSGSPPLPRRLRSIFLSYLHLPALPQLLLSSRDLVSLHLGCYTLTHSSSAYISPTVLSTSLSATTQLQHLHIDCFPILDHQEWTSETSPLNLIIFSSLTDFHFGGSIEYMESFVSRIHAPHLENLDINSHHDDEVLYIPQISLFISRTKWLSSLPFRTSILLTTSEYSIEHHFKRLKSSHKISRVYFRCFTWGEWQVSEVDHICTQLSPLSFSVQQLKISAFDPPPHIEHKTDPAPWLQLLSPYNHVEEIELCGRGAPCTGIAWALKKSIGETAQPEGLLPALRILRIRGFHTWSLRLLKSFVDARKLCGQPVVIRRLMQKNQDTDWETFDKNDDTR